MEIGEKYGIHPRDVEKIKFAFEVYDFKGDGKVDGFYIGDPVRACNLNPTMKTIAEIGGEKEKGKKVIVLEDMYRLFKKAKDSKDTGGIHDFVEILKLYDKNSDKTMLSKDLFRLLTNLGEKLTKEEAKGLMNELCDPEDAEGFTPFMPFLERMCKRCCLNSLTKRNKERFDGRMCYYSIIYNQKRNQYLRISGSRVFERLMSSNCGLSRIKKHHSPENDCKIEPKLANSREKKNIFKK